MTANDYLEQINYFLDLKTQRELTPKEELTYDFADKMYSLHSLVRMLTANGVKPQDVENHFMYKNKFKQCVDAKTKLDNYKE